MPLSFPETRKASAAIRLAGDANNAEGHRGTHFLVEGRKPGRGERGLPPLEEAVASFFAKDSELEQAVSDALYQQVFDYEYRNTVHKHQELLPAPSMDFPAGYADVRELLSGEGVWQDMASVQTETFVGAFVFSSSSAFNPFIHGWVERIQSARAGIVPALGAISAFCESGATQNGIAIHFEEHGGIVSAPTKRETGESIYLDHGYLDIITLYGLDVHIPSWLAA